jgi:hypothetical protein
MFHINQPIRSITSLGSLKSMLLSAGLLITALVILATASVSAQGVYNPNAPYLTPMFIPNDTLGPCAFGEVSLVGNENREKIWNFLIERGLSAEQAAGVMGNLYQESRYNPTLQENHPNYPSQRASWEAEAGGWGIAQWSFGRREVIRDRTISQLGPEYYTMDELPPDQNDALLALQLQFLYEEMQVRIVDRAVADASLRGMTEWEAMLLMNTVEDALFFFHDSFERSADTRDDIINKRLPEALAVYQEFGGNVSTVGLSGCTPLNTSGLIETVLLYAWPEDRGSGTAHARERKPEYAAAITAARSAGGYVGGDVLGGGIPGVDCGAFVTRVMVDSGFDRQYNHAGIQSQGAGPTETQLNWVRANWQKVGKGSDLSITDLQPGDVAFQVWPNGDNFGHTFMWVGEVPGFDSTIASASLYDRAPAAGGESPLADDVEWYRKR